MRHEFSRVPGNTGRTDLDKCDKILAQRIEAKRANDYEVAVRRRLLQPARSSLPARSPACPLARLPARPPAARFSLLLPCRSLRASSGRERHPPPPCPTPHASCSRQDKLRDQLRRDLGVEVMDRERLWWSVNGERGQMPQFKASSHDYRREDNLDGVDIESINAILAQRLQARPAPAPAQALTLALALTPTLSLAPSQARFQLHLMDNGHHEAAEQRACPHRDFYNIRKVDRVGVRVRLTLAPALALAPTLTLTLTLTLTVT